MNFAVTAVAPMAPIKTLRANHALIVHKAAAFAHQMLSVRHV